jgi:hypothetical protein
MTEYALKAQPCLKLFHPALVIKVARSSWIAEMVAEGSEVAHRPKGNGAGAMTSLRTAALNLPSLAGFQSVRYGMQAVLDEIKAQLATAMRQPTSGTF